MKITIENGQESHTLDAEVLLTGSTSVLMSVDSSVVSLSTDPSAFADFSPVRTINEIHPAADGSFYISGSECDSWEYLGGGTIGLVDLCPSCQTCDAVYRMKNEIEDLKMFLNALKDANLYSQNVVTDRTNLLIEQRQFSGVDTPCITGGTVSQFYPKGLQLLQQYVTLVRMWNYVVSQNNSSTVIDVAPEDTSGFTVQTKRSLPSCGNDSRICCTLAINYFGYINDNTGGAITQASHPAYKERVVEIGGHTESAIMNGLSIYTPDPVVTLNGTKWPTKTAQRTEFKPFADQDFAAAPKEVFTGETVVISGATTMISCSGCTYSTGWMGVHERPADMDSPIEVKKAGTYAVYLKVLPFCGVEMYNKDNQIINIRDGVNIIEGEISGSTTTEYILKPTSVAFPCYNNGGGNAQEADYLNSKCAPSVSVPYKNVWQINVTWLVERDDGDPDNPQTQQYSDTYYYTCTGVPLYYGDQVMTNSVIENKFPPPEPTDA